MERYQIPPPAKFDVSKPEEWPKWKKRFERYRIASGLDVQPGENQVNALLYTMGEDAEDVVTSLQLTDEALTEYETVLERLEGFFVVRRNVIFERAKFNLRHQEEKETVDSFITALYCLAEHCGYGALHEEMIRDRLVVGLRDKKLSEQLQLNAELTLDRAVTRARQSERVKKQQEIMKSNFKPDTSANVDSVRFQQRSYTTNKEKVRWQTKGKMHVAKQQHDKGSACKRCGRAPAHSTQQCPARDETCNSCHRRGHYARVCLSRTVGEIEAATESDSDEDVAFLGLVNSQDPDNGWVTELKVNEHETQLKIDTGADVTVLPESEYKTCKSFPPLQMSDKVLYGAGMNRLPVKGKFTATLKSVSLNNTIEQDVYVVSELKSGLLGRTASVALGLVARVAGINAAVSQENVKEQFPQLFSGLGKLNGEYKIKLNPDAKPYSLSTPRRIPLPLMAKVKKELKRMEDLGVISKVEQPTDWCAGMVTVPKPNDEVRICVDLTKLNKSVRREKHMLPSVEHTLGQLEGAKVFSKLDANSGFWQIPLSEDSRLLTTFITPFGRYCFNRLCFGISSAPEHFQRRMSRILEGLEGVLCQMDDVLVYAETQSTHDGRLWKVLKRLEENGVTLKTEKCEFSKSSVKFLGQVIDAQGVRADPNKIKAVAAMEEPRDVSGVRRFLGMVNHLGKYIPQLAEKTQPLRDLLRVKNMWTWGQPQQQALDSIKGELSSPPVMALYNTQAYTVVSADSSSYALGAVLLQKQEDHTLKPVAYASRALSDTERRYAQIEKEALAVTWACERFSDFLVGIDFHIETDHKPLVPLLGVKDLDELPPRIQRLRMRLMRYRYTIAHVPGKLMATADVLSRAPQKGEPDTHLETQLNLYVNMILSSLPATETRLQEIKEHQDRDEVIQEVKKYCHEGWPDRCRIDGRLRQYAPFEGELTVEKGLLLRNKRLVIPKTLQADIMEKLHAGHFGIVKCRERARQSVWWPGLSTQLKNLVEACDTCARDRVHHKEPLMPSDIPERPWEVVGADLFEWNQHQYLLIVDYLSRYIEIAKLSSTTSAAVIQHLKSIFARHGIPSTVRTDNGPQFSSDLFCQFAKGWSFQHITSTPRFPQSNGEAERAVRTIKHMLKKESDPYLALMTYRATPLSNGHSPAELLMGRRLRTTLPVVPSSLRPRWTNLQQLRQKEQESKKRQQRDFNRRHRAHHLPWLNTGDHVWVSDTKERGTVLNAAHTPRSYLVETPSGVLRRNRRHLVNTPVAPGEPEDSPDAPPDTAAAEPLPAVHNSAEQEHLQPSSPDQKRYPARERRVPGHLRDFVTS